MADLPLNVRRTDHAVDPAHLCPVADRCVASAILNDASDLAFSTPRETFAAVLKRRLDEPEGIAFR